METENNSSQDIPNPPGYTPPRTIDPNAVSTTFDYVGRAATFFQNTTDIPGAKQALSTVENKLNLLQIVIAGSTDGPIASMEKAAGIVAGGAATTQIIRLIGANANLPIKLAVTALAVQAGSQLGDDLTGLKQQILSEYHVLGHVYDHSSGNWYPSGVVDELSEFDEFGPEPASGEVLERIEQVQAFRQYFHILEDEQTGRTFALGKDGTYGIIPVEETGTVIKFTDQSTLVEETDGTRTLFFKSDNGHERVQLDAQGNVIEGTRGPVHESVLDHFINPSAHPYTAFDDIQIINGNRVFSQELPNGTFLETIETPNGIINRIVTIRGETIEQRSADFQTGDSTQTPAPIEPLPDDTAPADEKTGTDIEFTDTGTPGNGSLQPEEEIYLEDEGLLGHPNPSYEDPDAEDDALTEAIESIDELPVSDPIAEEALEEINDQQTIQELQQAHAAVQSVISLIHQIENGNDVNIAAQSLVTVDALDTVFEFTDSGSAANTALGGAATIASTFLAVNHLVDSIEDGDPLAIAHAGLSTYAAASAATELLTGQALAGGTAVSSVLAPINLVISIAQGDALGTLSSVLIMSGNPIAVGIGIVLSVFGSLFGSDPWIPYSPPQGRGVFTVDDDNELVYQVDGSDANFADFAARSLDGRMGELLEHLDGSIASGEAIVSAAMKASLEQIQANLGEGEVIVAERLPIIEFHGHYFHVKWLGDDLQITGQNVAPSDLARFVAAQAEANQALVSELEAETIAARQADGQDTYFLTQDQIASLIDLPEQNGLNLIAIDFNGDGLISVSQDASQLFDYDSDGFLEAMQWIGADDGVLSFAADPGEITDGRHLLNGGLNGHGALSFWDINNDGIINDIDPAYSALGVWRDINQDTQMQAGEHYSLASLGVSEIRYLENLATVDTANGPQIARLAPVNLAASDNGVQLTFDEHGRLEVYESGDERYVATDTIGGDDDAEARANREAEQNREAVHAEDVTANDVDPISPDVEVIIETLGEPGDEVADGVIYDGYEYSPEDLARLNTPPPELVTLDRPINTRETPITPLVIKEVGIEQISLLNPDELLPLDGGPEHIQITENDISVLPDDIGDIQPIDSVPVADDALLIDPLSPLTDDNNPVTPISGSIDIQPEDSITAVDAFNNAPISGDVPLVDNGAAVQTFSRNTLLANAVDIDGDTLNITAIDNVVGGSAELLQDGSVRFERAVGHSGDIGFDYRVSDGNLSSTATAATDVLPAEDDGIAATYLSLIQNIADSGGSSNPPPVVQEFDTVGYALYDDENTLAPA